MFSIIRNDKYMPTPGIRRIRDKVCKKWGTLHEAYLAYLRAVNDGESFVGGQLRNGRFALKRTCFRRVRVARRKDTWTRIASRRSYRPQSVRTSDKPLRSSVLSDRVDGVKTRQTRTENTRISCIRPRALCSGI